MGWIAVTKEYQVLREGEHGRPVEAGNEGNLLFIMQEDYGHRVAIDLINGTIIVGYDDWIVENNDVQIVNPGFVFRICNETSIVGEIKELIKGEPDAEGWYTQELIDLVWRPIWFTRVTNGDPTKVIGAQTTLPELDGGNNVKKMVSLFSTGAIGID
jgi:hypothetical protein